MGPKKQETGVRKAEQDVVRARPRADRRASARTTPTDNDIARRAYQLYVQRGGQHGHDFDDWLVAERELQTRKS